MKILHIGWCLLCAFIGVIALAIGTGINSETTASETPNWTYICQPVEADTGGKLDCGVRRVSVATEEYVWDAIMRSGSLFSCSGYPTRDLFGAESVECKPAEIS